ncbi:MAG: DUF3034 family protein [Pseudomonadota bacterium]
MQIGSKSLCLIALMAMGSATASVPDMGKLLATGGVSQVEGAGGGGLVPWALISGYGTRDSWGANAHFTALRTQDYALDSAGISVGLADRVELSLAQQHLTGSLAPLDQLSVRQDILGIKVKLAGDAVYGQDQLLPQIAVGALFKRQRGIDGLGERSSHGADLYLAATKICLDSSVLLNATLRATRANQMGLLGFGGDQDNRYRLMPEVSVAWMASRKLVAGLEYRHKPHNLALDREKPNADVFVAWFPSKQLSLTAAYVVLGDVTVFNPTRQRGAYLSLQTGF